MDFNQFVYFHKVAETKNISKAAASLFISQPALSMSIKKLEQELGVVLFTRSNGQVLLTENGKKLLKHVETVLSEIEYIQCGLFQEQKSDQPLRLVSCDGPSLRYFSAAIMQPFQNLTIQTISQCADSLVHDLKTGTADIIFTDHPLTDNDIYSTYLCEAMMSISVPPSHPLYSKCELSWQDLDHETFLTPTGTSFLLSRIHEIETEKHLDFKRVMQGDSALFFQMSRSTHYLYFDSTIDHILPRNPKRRNLKMTDPPLYVRYYGSCLKSRQSAMQPYLNAVQKYYWAFDKDVWDSFQ